MDSRNPQAAEFHQKCAPFFHTLNIYMERIAPQLVKQSNKLWEVIRKRRDRDTKYLNNVKAHFPSHTVHFNAGTDDPKVEEAKKYHADIRSCWSGFDVVGVLGKYDGGELEFPGLKYSFPSRPGDLFFLRGAAFRHGAVDWQGEGRMIFALFADKNTFTKECIPRPQDLDHMYGTAYRAFRQKFPITLQGPAVPPDKRINYHGEGDDGDDNGDDNEDDGDEESDIINICDFI